MTLTLTESQMHVIAEMRFLVRSYITDIKKVQAGNDQEMAQRERNSHSKNRRINI